MVRRSLLMWLRDAATERPESASEKLDVSPAIRRGVCASHSRSYRIAECALRFRAVMQTRHERPIRKPENTGTTNATSKVQAAGHPTAFSFSLREKSQSPLTTHVDPCFPFLLLAFRNSPRLMLSLINSKLRSLVERLGGAAANLALCFHPKQGGMHVAGHRDQSG